MQTHLVLEHERVAGVIKRLAQDVRESIVLVLNLDRQTLLISEPGLVFVLVALVPKAGRDDPLVSKVPLVRGGDPSFFERLGSVLERF